MTTRWAPEKRDVLRELATELLHNYGRGRVLVAVDAAPGTPTAGFADELAEALREQGHAAFRASTADFARPRAEGGGLDESLLRRVLVEPFRLGGSTGWQPAAWDAAADRAVEASWVTGPADAILVVDGAELDADALRGAWHASLWLAAAGEARGGALRARATIIVDASDPEHPRRVFDDAC